MNDLAPSMASVRASMDLFFAPFVLAIERSRLSILMKEYSHLLIGSVWGGFHLDTNIFFAAVIPAKNTFFLQNGIESEESSFSSIICGKQGMDTCNRSVKVSTTCDQNMSTFGHSQNVCINIPMAFKGHNGQQGLVVIPS